MPPPFFTHAPPSKRANHRYFALFISTLFSLSLLPLHTACLPPAPLDCTLCPADRNCGVNTGFVCKDGYCVPESDPNPARCKTELPDVGLEKTEPLDETSPEEATHPEEAANPEEPTTPEPEPYIETEPERPETPDTQHVLITLLEGDDDREQPLSYPTGTSAPPNAKEAKFRFRTSWRVFGANLRRIDSWKLQSKDKSQTFTLTATDIKDTDMKLTLPAALTAGFFTLLGLIANTPTVQAEVYVLQGKDGKDGAQGPKGDTGTAGKDGDTKFTDADATALKALLLKLQASGDNLNITANTVSFKPTSGGNVTLDLGASASLKSGNATLDFAGDAITVTSTTFSVDTTSKIALKSPDVAVASTTFEVKGTANKVSFKIDDANKKATFDTANVHVQSGLGQTAPPGPTSNDPPQTNGLGNLIIGYNETRPSGNPLRTGSHNLIIGAEHHYTSHSGFAQGKTNSIRGELAGVFGGSGNTASSQGAGVFGGSGNTASGVFSSVHGGGGSTTTDGNKAEAKYSSIHGGRGWNIVAGTNDAKTFHGQIGEIVLCGPSPSKTLCQQ
ncbi:hypothetical protein L6R29_21555 [Myxococcota bacterium]|nr:hypothetical protein [Myxococcota bacterium]